MPDSAAAPTAPWIADPDALLRWLNGLPPTAVLGMDTEFMRRNTFYPQLALLQLGCNERHALVDPLAFDIGDLLQPWLTRGDTVSVMHSASEDLETLSPLLPGGPRELFDTQIASAFVGLGMGISYRALVAELAGADLDKGETRSDWMQRPLTASQKLYATLDVVYLKTIHEQLSERLRQRDQSAWHAEDCERLKRKAAGREGDGQPQRSFRSAAEWPSEQQALLRRVLLWRDRTARALDRPRPWLLEDALVLSLSEQPPGDNAALDQRSRGQRALRSPQRAELFELLQRPLDQAEVAATNAIPAVPQGDAKKALTAMKACVETRAGELDIPAGLLCSRKVLEEYVVTTQWPDFLDGWRSEVLGEALPPLLP